MKMRTKSTLLLTIIVLFVIISSNHIPVEARKQYRKKNKSHKNQKQRNASGRSNDANPSIPPSDNFPTQSSIFNIMSFGAKGDGVSDDSKALLTTWRSACRVPGGVLQVPSGYKFLIKPVTLQGPCMPNLIFQIDGSLLAPPKIGSWPKSSLYQWINFKWIHNFTIQGSGTFDGQGCNWWRTSSQFDFIQRRSKIPDLKPTALRFYASNYVTVRDVRIMNSPQCHLKFDNSGQVIITNVTISAPGNTPNTDGIHLQNSKDVEIYDSNIGCGDDCVSIQTGCSNVHVHHVNCGPGHGISLGGLGKANSVACVSDIVVDNINMENTLYGVRIKTWQGGMGLVKNVSFSNVQVMDVKVPIMIDQYYCDKSICKNQTEAVAIIGVKYDQIFGNYTVQPIHLACSSDVPCTNVDLIDIQLTQSPGYRGFRQALCWNSYGKSQAPLLPSSIDYCLRSASDTFINNIARSNENTCELL